MRKLTLLLTLCIAQSALAADHNAALKDYLTDDVVAVAYVDLSSLDTLGVLEWVADLGLISSEERGEAAQFALEAQQRLDEIADFGASHVYLLFRVSDLSHGGPSWIVPVARDGDPRSVLNLIRSGQPSQGDADAAVQPSWLPEFWETADGALLGGNTEAQLNALKNTGPKHVRDLSDAWEALGQGDCGLIIFGDADSRRVVREMFPPLPEPFAALNGELIADSLPWGGFSLNLPPEPGAEIVVESHDSQTASTVDEIITNGLTVVKSMSLTALGLQDADRNALVEAFTPQMAGTQVRINLDQRTGAIKRLTELIAPPIQKMRQQMYRNNRMNQFKDIARAMLNYYHKNERLPARANYDDNGKPLLSWRVHILPFLEQQALYQQFHQDEPWDSEHNRKLIDKMPAIYADFDPALSRINEEGKTTFVVPVGEGTVFDGPIGTTIKEIIDGTSNTILLVEVVPERAVVWTKPDDWEVDFDEPMSGVKRSDRDEFVAAWCDGSVRVIPNTIEGWQLLAMLTKAGEEVVNWP